MLCSQFQLTCAGYTSRVMFFSVLTPTKISSYISEVLDAGFLGPLFKVDLFSFLFCFSIC